VVSFFAAVSAIDDKTHAVIVVILKTLFMI